MFSTFLSRLKAIFQPMSELSNTIPSESPFMLSNDTIQLDISSYVNHIEFMLMKEDGRWDMLRQHVVTNVQYLKEKDTESKHEYLVVTLVDHDGATAHLLVERSKDPSNIPASNLTASEKVALSIATSDSDALGSSAAKAPKGPSKKRQLLSLASASHSVSSINSAASGTPASSPESFQDSFSSRSPASDMVRRRHNYYRPPPTDTAILVFEPSSSSDPDKGLTLLQLSTIIKAVHDFKPDYHVLRSQCYWFAMTIFGVLLLHGGRLKSYPLIPSRKVPEPDWKDIRPLTPLDPDFGKLPIPDAPDDFKEILKEHGAAGKKGIITVMRPCLDDIWTLHQKANDTYESLKVQYSNMKSTLDIKTEELEIAQREAKKAEERAANLERKLAAYEAVISSQNESEI